MLKQQHLGCLLALAMALSACGGGGGGSSSGGGNGGSNGGGGGGGNTSTDYKLTFLPATLTASYAQGSAQPLTVTATLDRAVSQTINVAVVDSVGVIEPNVQLAPGAGLSYQATITPKSSLAAGDHTGSLQVKLCFDNPATCSSPLAGSPFSLPYKFTVTAPAAATVSPAQVSMDGSPDELTGFKLSISLHDGPAYLTLVDKGGAFDFGTDPVAASGEGLATLQVKAGLATGQYTGQIELHVCKQKPCVQEMAGSPVIVPYSIALGQSVNLTPLARTAGVAEWAQHQANASHTGYVPMTLDASKFNRRWRWTASYPDTLPTNASGMVQPVVTSNDMLYVLVSGETSSGMLFALSEQGGALRWQKGFDAFAANPPSTDAGSVYLATSGHSQTAMWGLDGSTGAQKFRTPFDAQWERYMAPTIANGNVYSDGGYAGGMVSFRLADGKMNWSTGLAQYDRWTPVVDDTYAYVYMPEGLTALKISDGSKAFAITATPGVLETDVSGAPMLIGSNTVAYIKGNVGNGPNRLMTFDTAARNVKWSVTGAFMGAPAHAKGVIYAINGSQVEARNGADGTLLWAWKPDETSADPFKATNYWLPALNIIVTDNLLFVSSNAKVYAVNLATHQAVWSLAKPGTLALSPNGVLYVTSAPSNGQRGGVNAINLR